MASIFIFIFALMLAGTFLNLALRILRICIFPFKIIGKILLVIAKFLMFVMKKTWQMLKYLLNRYSKWFDRHYEYRNNFDRMVLN